MSSKDVFQLGQYNIRSSGELQPRKIHNMHIYNTVYIYYILDYIWPIHVVVYYRTNGPSLLGKAG